MIDATAITARLAAEPDRWIDLGHTRLPHWIIGAGPDLVFVHGWPLHSGTWRRVVAALSDRFTCHLIDLPGAGRSAWTDDSPSDLAGLSDALADALERMELGPRFGLVAHDSGGGMARIAAARMPDRLAGMVLGNTEIPGYHPLRLKLLLGLARTGLIGLTLPLTLRTRLGRNISLRSCVAETGLIESELKPLFTDPLVHDERARAGALRVLRRTRITDFDAAAEAQRVLRAPVRMVWGVEDGWFPLERARELAGQFPTPATLVGIAGASLFVHEDAPARFAAEVDAHFSAAFASGMPAAAAG